MNKIISKNIGWAGKPTGLRPSFFSVDPPERANNQGGFRLVLIPNNPFFIGATLMKNQTFNIAGIKINMIKIPAGTFVMGSPEDEPERFDDETQKEVTIEDDFYMGETLVTQELWGVVMGDNPSHFTGEDNLPVDSVSQLDCLKFIKRLQILHPAPEGYEWALPSEEEWEYAARAGTTTPFYTGDCITTDQANFDGRYPYGDCPKGEYRGKTTPVKTFAPNPWGLFDMLGNLWEWTRTPYGNGEREGQ